MINDQERPRLLPLTETIREQRQELMAQVAKAWVQKHYAQELQQERASCPHCGLPLRRWGFAPRTVETLIGTFPLERPYFYGRACQAGFCPLDGVLGLAERDKQYDLQKAAVQVAPEMPYETASALFGELTKAGTTGQRDNRTTRQRRVWDVVPMAEEVGQRVAAGVNDQ